MSYVRDLDRPIGVSEWIIVLIVIGTCLYACSNMRKKDALANADRICSQYRAMNVLDQTFKSYGYTCHYAKKTQTCWCD